MIDESVIEKVANTLTESGEEIESRFIKNHGNFYNYLQIEIFSALSEELRSQLYFIIIVIHEAYFLTHRSLAQFNLEDYIENEDLNWQTSEKNSDWKLTVDSFFNNYPEEDLLAFVEDITIGTEDSPTDSAALKVLFIISKSYIDTIVDKY